MKILVVLPRFPYPLEKGDKLRAFNQIKELSKNNQIYLFAATHVKVNIEHIEAVRPYCQEILLVRSPKLVNMKNVIRNYFSTKSLQIGYWDSRQVRKACRNFAHQVQPDVIYSQMVRTMTWVSRLPEPKVMDFQDALSMNVERRMEHSRFLWHYILHFEFKMLRSSEYNSFKIFDALTIISEPDSDAIPRKRNCDISIIPNGVDFDFFHPIEREKKYDIVFCGNMCYEPNVRASIYLAHEIMPLVWKKQPKATLLLAGAYPKRGIRHLADERITVSGFVDDIREAYASAKVFAAPMLTGSGLQNKLLEAMAMGIPCVTTSIANDSLGAERDKEILVGDSSETFAAHLVDLLQHEEHRCQLVASATDFVHQHYSWEYSCKCLEQVLQSVVGHDSRVKKEMKRKS